MRDDPQNVDSMPEPEPARQAGWSKPVAIAIIVVGVAAIGILAVQSPTTNREVATSGAAVPQPITTEGSSDVTPIQLAALDGSALQIPSGEPTVVYFMSSTGCVPCEIGAGKLQEVYAENQLGVIALEMIPGTPAEWMMSYQQILGLDYPVVEDPDGAVSLRYGIVSLSIAIVVDATGQKIAGPFDPADRAVLDEALATIGVQRPMAPASSDTQPAKLLP